MNDQFRDPDETGYLLDEVKQMLGEKPDPLLTDETVIYRPAAPKTDPLPLPKEPAEDAFELDIHFDDDEQAPTMPEKPAHSVKAYNSDYVVPNRSARAPAQPPVQPVYRAPVQPAPPTQPVSRAPAQPPREVPQKRSQTMHDAPVRAERPKQKKKHPLLKTLFILLLALVLIFAAVWFFFPKRPDATAMKKGDVATVLIAGTDKDGTRTDTMLLLYIDRDAGEVNLLSLPRDLLTYVDGNPMKLNAVYGYGGCGEAGMELLMDEMVDRIGFRPDGYMLFDFDAVEKLINRMGGITFEVPCDMDYEDPSQSLSIHLKEGKQHLSGEEALWVLRYRSGYALADLKRVEVQRDLVKAALTQWTKVWRLPRGVFALPVLTKGTTTDLSFREMLWLARSARSIGLGDAQLSTLPGEWNSPYYYPAPQDGADLLNRYFNPTARTITAEDVGY